jgi:hypothetical protein
LAIILHIGSPKTGTSSIQAFGRRHRDTLRRRGIDFPPINLVGGPDWSTHSALARAASAQPVRGFDAARFVAEIRKRAASATVLLSAEAMYLGRFPAEPPDGRDDLARHEAFVARVRALFGDDPPSIRLVLRRRDSFAASFYQQIIQSDRYAGAFETFLETHRSLFDYRGITEIWARHFPRVDLRVFEDLVAGPGPVANFLGDLGVDVTDLEAERRNAGIPIEVTEFVRHLNATPVSEEVLRRIRRLLTDPAFPGRFGAQRSAGYFDVAGLGAFLAPYDADDAWLLERYRPTGRPTLFPPPGNPGARFDGIDAATAAAVAAHLLEAPGAPPRARGLGALLGGRWRRR